MFGHSTSLRSKSAPDVWIKVKPRATTLNLEGAVREQQCNISRQLCVCEFAPHHLAALAKAMQHKDTHRVTLVLKMTLTLII